MSTEAEEPGEQQVIKLEAGYEIKFEDDEDIPDSDLPNDEALPNEQINLPVVDPPIVMRRSPSPPPPVVRRRRRMNRVHRNPILRRFRRPNPWLRYLDDYRARNNRQYVNRPNQLVRDASVVWNQMTWAQKLTFR